MTFLGMELGSTNIVGFDQRRDGLSIFARAGDDLRILRNELVAVYKVERRTVRESGCNRMLS